MMVTHEKRPVDSSHGKNDHSFERHFQRDQQRSLHQIVDHDFVLVLFLFLVVSLDVFLFELVLIGVSRLFLLLLLLLHDEKDWTMVEMAPDGCKKRRNGDSFQWKVSKLTLQSILIQIILLSKRQ
jgi:hypothetical protein